MMNHCLNLMTNFRLILMTNSAKANCFHLILMTNYAMENSYHLNGKEPGSCCVEEQNKYLNGQAVNWSYFVVPVCFLLSANEKACCC